MPLNQVAKKKRGRPKKIDRDLVLELGKCYIAF